MSDQNTTPQITDPLTLALLELIDQDGRRDAEIARESGLPQQRIADMRGGRRTATLPMLRQLAVALRLSPTTVGRLVLESGRGGNPEKLTTTG